MKVVNNTLPDTKKLLQDAWSIFLKRIVLFTLLCLPIVFGVKILFDVFLTIYATGSTKILSSYTLFFIIYFIGILFIRNILLLQLNNSISFIESFR